MLPIFFFGLIIFGFFLIISSFFTLTLDKSLIELPSLFMRARKNPDSKSKYKFYTQFLWGIILMLYGVVLLKIGVSNFSVHLLVAVIMYVIIDALGYLKCIG